MKHIHFPTLIKGFQTLRCCALCPIRLAVKYVLAGPLMLDFRTSVGGLETGSLFVFVIQISSQDWKNRCTSSDHDGGDLDMTNKYA